jgi:hypothetical protein
MRVEVEGHASTNAELRSVAAGELKASSSAHVDRLPAEFEPPNSSPVRLWWNWRDMVLS